MTSPLDRPDYPRRRIPLWLRLAVIPLVLVLVGIGFYAVRGFVAAGDLRREDDLLIGYDGRPTPGIGQNFLVLSQSAPHRTEVVMLLHRNALGNRLFMISLPQNLQITANGVPRQLQDFTEGGELARAIETQFGVRIEHVATIDIKGFIGLVESVGGVVVKNPVASTTISGIHFAQGEISLRGDEALEFVDDESEIPNRDSVLAERQRAVLRALVLKVLRPETLANPMTFDAVLSQVTQYVTVDRGMTNEVMWNLATSTHVRSSADFVAAKAPVQSTTTGAGEPLSVLDEAATSELATALRTDRMTDYSKRHPA